MQNFNIVSCLKKLCEEKPNYELYRFIENESLVKVVSPIELDKEARKIAAELQQHDCYQKPVIILYEPGFEYVYALFACFYAGAIPIPVYPPLNEEMANTLLRIIDNSKATLLLTNQKIKSNIKKLTFFSPLLALLKKAIKPDIIKAVGRLNQFTLINSSKIKAYPYVEISTSLNDIAYLQYTSGSTKAPKGVVIKHSALMANLKQLKEAAHFTEKDVLVSWLPPYHDMGLVSSILMPVVIGFQTVHLSPIAFLQKPSLWLKMISDYKGTVAGGPDFSYRICINKIQEKDLDGVDLSSWRLAFCGAEMVKPTTADDFYQKFKAYFLKEDIFTPCYGLAEAVLYVCGVEKGIEKKPLYKNFNRNKLAQEKIAEPNFSEQDNQTIVTVGICPKNCDIKIVEPESGTPLSEGQVGEIWFSGPNAAQSYWNNELDSANMLNAKLKGINSDLTYIRTGDLGFQYENELFITGRSKDLIIINGFNHYAEDIEFSIQQQFSKNEIGSVVAFSIETEKRGEDLIILVETKMLLNKVENFSQLVREIVLKKHFIAPKQIAMVPARTLPKTTSGKLKRNQCKENYLNDKIHFLHKE